LRDDDCLAELPGGLKMRVWGIGEVLWDVFPDNKESLGGAPLNFCANVQRLGDTATLLSAVGRDARGSLALKRMAELGLSTKRVHVEEGLPTGVAVVGTTEAGEPSFVIPRPAAFDRLSTQPGVFEEIEAEAVDWVYFGTLAQTQDGIEQFTTELAGRSPHVRCFYDMNLRPQQWNLALVQRLSHLATVIKLNEGEAMTLFAQTQPQGAEFTVEGFCRAWADTYSIQVVCVTLGPAGCSVYERDGMHTVPGFAVKVCDTVGSGDAFAAGFLHGYHRGWPIAETARFANALGALVASRAGATPDWTKQDCLKLLASELPGKEAGKRLDFGYGLPRASEEG
jgi:fructokinase